jgi:dipeptidyl aminopeptidase/acylaminoacyl peptidase
MRSNYKLPLFVATFYLLGCSWNLAFAQGVRKSFTVADEIGLWLFTGDTDQTNPRFSPDGKYFAVYAERGRLDLNRPESSLKLYRSMEVANFLTHSENSQPPLPLWDISLSTSTEGPIIHDWRWLPDSSGVAFLQHINDNQQLVIANLRQKKIEVLTSGTTEDFDIRDQNHFIYTTVDPLELKNLQDRKDSERHVSAVVGTGRHLSELVVPDDPVVISRFFSPRACLWAVLDRKRFEVKHNKEPIIPKGDLVLSPDGHSVVTTLPVPNVPQSWETLYPPPFASSPDRIHSGNASASEYVRINLQTGSIQSLMDAPISSAAGWWAGGKPDWSSDGQDILLPATFLKTKENVASRPCVAVVDLPTNARTCVEELKGRTEKGYEDGYHAISGVRFAGGDKSKVQISFRLPDGSTGTTEYQQVADGSWKIGKQTKPEVTSGHDGFEITVKQAIDEPPVLIASNTGKPRIIWDPNPQLKNFELGKATVYRWKDSQGREFKGGLFKPFNYKAGQHYPLVIQTHGYDGFDESFFSPSGAGMPTAFAARALAAVGIIVLQVDENCPFVTPEEGPCAVSAYESGVHRLVSDGLVDEDKIGIIGFSRSCFYVMEALTSSSLHLRAASITSGLMFDYWQSMFSPDADEGYAIIGVPPFGKGLQLWLERSPGFNLDKVNAPLMVVGEGRHSLLSMWGAYAGLHHLRRPVDLIMLNTDEHVLTNPALRMASQGGSVDWFRFWLQDYEDHDPVKTEQYKRWRELRRLQDQEQASKPLN